jgi:hypothetical protein
VGSAFHPLTADDGNVKKVMKNQSGRERKTSRSLPLEGGGKRVGVKEARDIARALRKASTDTDVFSGIEAVLETIREALVTPHPDPLPQGERGVNF